MRKVYLGDSVYAEADDATLLLKLTTENDGLAETNTIYLEPEVLDALGQFVQAWIRERQRPKDTAARS